MTVAVSVIVPVLNEEGNVFPLVEAIQQALQRVSSWEVLFVDDGSTDLTPSRIRECAVRDPRIRLITLARNYGQTAALQAGFDHARGAVMVSMDGDLQNDPADIPRLLAKLEEGFDLVAGYRERRQDAWLRRKLPSMVANRIIRWMTGVPIRDNGCSLKAYRRELVERMTLYSDLHRFIPAVAAATAGARITEVGVRHHARRHGQSKYGLSRIGKVLADLLTIKMIRSFRDRPLLLFGVGAVAAGLLGIFFAGAAFLSSASFAATKARAFVLPGVAALWLALSGYLFMLGFIAEIAVQRARAEQAERAPLAQRG